MSIEKKQEEVIEEFLDMETWEDRYHYIIDMGQDLKMDPKYHIPELKVSGCSSQAWLHAKYKEGKLIFTGDSDSIFVKGLMAILIQVYSNASPKDILNSSSEFLRKAGISENLSATRVNGVGSIILYMKNYAKKYSTEYVEKE